MADVAQKQMQTPIQKNGITVNDLTSKYQQKIDNYNNMINTMTDEQKKLFQIAINVYDIQLRQDRWDSYVGYALRALLDFGYYYDVLNGQWSTCQTKENFINPNPTRDTDDEAYETYIRNLYPREACSLLGISRWEILDANVDKNIIATASGGEMSYGYYDLELKTIGGEQKGAKTDPNTIKHPDIPISPKANIAEMTKGDNSKDKYIYAYTDSGISKNNRNWRPMIMDSIAQQVMENMPPGNLGHVKPNNVGFELPLPVITWIGATTEMLPDGVNKRLWLKGYIIPVEQGLQLKTFVRAKAINSISVFGGLTLLPNQETGVQDVLDIDLKSIDISGKLKEGLNSGITELAGEQHIPNVEHKEPQIQIQNKEEAKTMTLEELKRTNPQLAGEMRAEIIASMETEANQKVIMTKAGEMDTMVQTIGENPLQTVNNLKSFAGEMAEAVGVTVPQGATLPSLSDIIGKVKEAVTKVTKVTEALKPAEGQDVVAKAEEVAQAQQMVANQKAIDSVNAKYEELTSGITNDAVKNLVGMQFNGILKAKPENISENFEKDSIATLEAQVPEAIQTVTQNAQALMQTGQQAGEMAIFDNLGIGKNVGGTKSIEQMTDEEYATHLGY